MFLNYHDDDDEGMPGSGPTPRRADESSWRDEPWARASDLNAEINRLNRLLAPFRRAAVMLSAADDDGDQPLVVVPPCRTAEGAALYVRDFQALNEKTS